MFRFVLCQCGHVLKGFGVNLRLPWIRSFEREESLPTVRYRLLDDFDCGIHVASGILDEFFDEGRERHGFQGFAYLFPELHELSEFFRQFRAFAFDRCQGSFERTFFNNGNAARFFGYWFWFQLVLVNWFWFLSTWRSTYSIWRSTGTLFGGVPTPFGGVPLNHVQRAGFLFRSFLEPRLPGDDSVGLQNLQVRIKGRYRYPAFGGKRLLRRKTASFLILVEPKPCYDRLLYRVPTTAYFGGENPEFSIFHFR